MKKQKDALIIIGIIVVLAAFYFVPKLSLFTLLPPGECNFNSEGKFITNINYGQPEDIFTYYDLADNSQGWISVDWNEDGTNEGYGKVQKSYGGDVDMCASKTIITHTPSGLRVVKWRDIEPFRVGICSDDGKYVAFFEKIANFSGFTNVNQCSNFDPCANEPIAPMCSNNNITYSNACYLWTAGEGIQYEGACVQNIVTCTDFVYSPWTNCTNGVQERVVITSLPTGCTGGNPVWERNCTETDGNGNQNNNTLQTLCTTTNGTWTNSSCSCQEDYIFSATRGCEEKTFIDKYLVWIIIAIVLLILLVLLRGN